MMKKDPTAKRCWKSWGSASHGSQNEANPHPYGTLAGQGAAQLQLRGRVRPLVVKNRVTKKGESGTDDGIRNWKHCKHHCSWKAAASPVTSPLWQAEESVTVQHRVSSRSPETVSWVGARLGHGCKVFPSSSISFLPGALLPPATPALRHRAVNPPEELLMLQNTPEKKSKFMSNFGGSDGTGRAGGRRQREPRSRSPAQDRRPWGLHMGGSDQTQSYTSRKKTDPAEEQAEPSIRAPINHSSLVNQVRERDFYSFFIFKSISISHWLICTGCSLAAL